MYLEASPNWLLKNSLSDCVYQNDENSLRRSMTEIKTYEGVNRVRARTTGVVFQTTSDELPLN